MKLFYSRWTWRTLQCVGLICSRFSISQTPWISLESLESSSFRIIESVPFEQYSWGRGQPTSTALACSNPRFRNKKSCQRMSKKQHDQNVQRSQAGQRCQREIGAELSFKSLQVLAFGCEVTSSSSSIQTHLRFCSECQDYTLALYCESECTHFTQFLDLVLCMHRSCHWMQVRQILKMQRRCSPRVQVTAARPMRQKEWIPEGRPCQSEI